MASVSVVVLSVCAPPMGTPAAFSTKARMPTEQATTAEAVYERKKRERSSGVSR